MTERVHVLMAAEEKERYRRAASRAGKSLSEWLREAAADKAAAARAESRLRSASSLRSFFMECDAREEGREPEWEEHRRVIERSKRSGAA